MSGYYASNPHFDRSDIDVDQADAEEAAERHDELLRNLARDECNFKIRGALVIFNLEVGTALDKLNAGLIDAPQHTALFAAADKKFTDIVSEARAEMPIRIAKMRANDEAARLEEEAA